MRLPDFFIIGAAKSATTTLYKYLASHPQIHMSVEKEPNFFGADIKYQRGLTWYSELFSEAEVGQICGEASTDYSKFPEYPNVAKRIYAALPDAKFIYMLRNPIDRAYSYYLHQFREIPYTNVTFEDWLENTNSCLDGSNYMMQVEQYLNYFPKSAFLFIFTDDLSNNTQKCLAEIFSFLNVDSSSEIFQDLEKDIFINTSNKSIEINFKNYITRQIKLVPFVEPLLKVMPKSLRHQVYENIDKIFPHNPYIRQPMQPKTRELLRNYFAEPNQKLSIFLDHDLSFWQ